MHHDATLIDIIVAKQTKSVFMIRYHNKHVFFIVFLYRYKCCAEHFCFIAPRVQIVICNDESDDQKLRGYGRINLHASSCETVKQKRYSIHFINFQYSKN